MRVSALLVLLVTSTATAELRTIEDGVYSKDQARAGAKLYQQHCVTCHDKRYFGPVLKAWSGQSLYDFFMTMATTMPEANPGMLYDQEYVEIIAHILAQNKYKAGNDDLPAGKQALELITISP